MALPFEKILGQRFPFLLQGSWDGLDANAGNFKNQVHMLQRLPDDFTTICDVGCGVGYISMFFHLRGHSVLACDPGDRFMFKDEIEYLNGSIINTPMDRKFDAILISHVLEHILDPVNFIESIKSRLNDNGYLFVFVPHTTLTQSGHWWKGWDIAQLAVFLASFGFDCRNCFFEIGADIYNMMGFGRKTSRANSTGFSLDEALPWLPQKFEELAAIDADGIVQSICSDGVHYIDAENLFYSA